jgi:SlyX protein
MNTTANGGIMQHLEEKLAHLIRTVDDLSDVVATQQREMDRLTRRVEMLMQREAERESAQGEGVIMADQRPPHW